MVTVNVDLSEFEPLGPNMPKVQQRGMELTGLDMVNKLQRNSEIPGRLQVRHGRLKAWFIKKQSKEEVVIESPARYTAAQNYGSTHMIRPKNKKALHWGGRPGYFSKGHEITIPGKHFVEKSIKEVQPRIEGHFKVAISEVLE